MVFRFIFLYVFSFTFVAASLFSDQTFVDQEGKEIRVVAVKTLNDIDLVQGKDVLVRGFMTGYEDVPIVELDPEFKSIGDVRRFYEDYFDSELEHFKNGELIWIQAFEGDKLVGWSTFELEADGAAYMNLLVVDPDEQTRGVGKRLTFAICSEGLFPEVQEIRLLLRNVNEDGRKFYEKIGFSDFEYHRDDNFVDTSLLTGLKWRRKASN